MEKRFVTVHVKNGEFRMELIQFVTDANGALRAICMDEVGNFEAFPIEVVQGEGFEDI